VRIGHGFDSHAWEETRDKPLILGGVVFESERSLSGHSDADVIVHACIDALLSPAGLGDIGQVFPDKNPQLKGAKSTDMLEETIRMLGDAGWEILNIDCSVVADQPNISAKQKEIENRLTQITGAPVSVKGKHPEGLEELNGVVCFAVSLIRRINE